ncbi:MAG: SPOR domain-containing protein [Bacteroidota bacterium]|nr:SPOR domain-containing protein [Bacteroidota bacterium]
MKKLLTIIVCLFISVPVFSQGGVVSSHNLPPSVAPGQTIDVDFTLNKGSIGGFAKFQMDLPFGFSATNVDSKQGNFTFENQRVKIVWVSIPAEAAFTFKFKIAVPANALNVCSISAKFFYLENNVKKEVEMPVHTMKISGSGDVASTPTNTVATTPTNTVSSTPTNTVATTPTNTVATTPTNTVAATPTKTVTTTPTNTVSTAPTNTISTSKSNSGTVYKVQLGAFSSSPAKSKFPGVNLSIVEEGGFYKALSGNFNSLEQAQKHKSDLENKGYSGFIVTYQNGQRTGIIK